MPTKNPRITFMVSKDMMDRIEEYKFSNRMKNQTQAILSLINIGIKELTGEELEPPKEEISHEEKRVLRAYRNADPNAQRFALQLLENNPAKKKAANK